jgi:hypothetical protein
MPNLLQRGAAFLGSRMQQAAGRSVVYSRRSQTVTLTGWPAMQEYEVDDEDGIPRRHTFYDWTFTAEDLDFASDAEIFAARPGDQIRETLNGQEITYEAMPPGTKPVSERLDTAGVLVVVHCKIVKCLAS